MKNHWVLWSILFAAGILPLATSSAFQEPSDPPEAAQPTEPQEPEEDFSGLTEEQALAKVEELGQEYETELGEYRQKFQAATAEEKAELRSQMPRPAAYIERFQKLAALHPSTKVEALALVWIVQHQRAGEVYDKAIDVLVQNHSSLPELKPVVLALQYQPPSERNLGIIQHVLDNSMNRDTLGVAEYARLQLRKRAAEFKRELDSDPDMAARFEQAYGKEQVEYIKSLPELPESELLSGLERLQTEFSDVVLAGDRTIGKTVEGDIFEIRFLQIGKEAPDIEGEDIDGTEFKLSDYRGKVVVLDFWGDW
jgi:hypothetical protein